MDDLTVEMVKESIKKQRLSLYKQRVLLKFLDMCVGILGVVIIDVWIWHQPQHHAGVIQILGALLCGGYAGLSCSKWLEAKRVLNRKAREWEVQDNEH